jgi:2-polyprenyl-3-methyl-5-hydroxy-6-metoxy-1,4-benzoquinol methylase
MNMKSHWERVYQTKKPDEVSWYRAHLDISLELIEQAAIDHDAPIIDVGVGESTLVDDLLGCDYRNVAVLDLSSTALDVAKARPGDEAIDVAWLCRDVTGFAFAPHRYDVWHDRAVFHFLMDPKGRQAYVQQVTHAVKPGAQVIIATFGPDGPTQCSGLDIVRYESEALHKKFGVSTS